MSADSYTLREAAELLGVSKRTLQRRMQEGAFSGRFLAPGRHGLEIRIPAREVEAVLREMERSRRPGVYRGDPAAARPRNERMGPVRESDSLVPYAAAPPPASIPEPAPVPLAESALGPADLETIRDATLAIVREERDSFLLAIREALRVRDVEVSALRGEIDGLRHAMEAVRGIVARVDQRLHSAQRGVGALGSAGTDAGSRDIEAVLGELKALEAVLRGSGD